MEQAKKEVSKKIKAGIEVHPGAINSRRDTAVPL